MTKRGKTAGFGRRTFLRGVGGMAALAAGAGLLPGFLRRGLLPAGVGEALADTGPANLFFAGTDGWICLPSSPAISIYHPDSLAPEGQTTYIFGFRDVTRLTGTQRAAQKNHAQHSAPLFWLDQFDPASPADFNLDLTNLGLAQRPDLTDSHTVHWHGFRNVIPFFDGEPTGSISVPVGRVFRYIYRPRDPGTYMFHCHVEDVEHVHMGMTGPVFVRPLQNKRITDPGKFAYNDGLPTADPRSTRYDREFAIFLSEVWAEAHWADAHIQLPDWTDYRADFGLLNGRAYPDTLAPNAPLDGSLAAATLHSMPFAFDPTGELVAPPGRPDLQHQPLSGIVSCCAGDRVLLRFANLGFKPAAMTLPGIPMRIVGKDATPMLGRDGTDTSYVATTLNFGAGESIDAIFTAPPKTGAGYDTYVLYNRAFQRAGNGPGQGGQRTEVRVYAAGALPAQLLPNT
jgi:FtsP/CotA-like multicopper oxidase with cupredoxin domain